MTSLLYGILGIVLYFSGISVLDKPLEFIAIFVVVALIDLKD